MKKLIAPLALVAVLVLTGCSTSGSADSANGSATDSTRKATSTPTPDPVEIPDLTGDWKQNNTKSDDGWTSATIADGTITVNFVTDGGDTTSLFWVGTYQAPTDDKGYTWTSTRDKAATESALLASGDDTKEFTFEDDELRFPVSIAGTSTTVRMSKV